MGQNGIPISIVVLFLGIILGAMAFVGLVISVIFSAAAL